MSPMGASGPEFTRVEKPLIDRLAAMGWTYTPGDLDAPTATGRDSFRDVLLENDLRQVLARINLDPEGRPWLDDGRIGQAVAALERHGARRLMEANQATTAVLLAGTTVEGLPGWDGGRARTVHYIDWDHPERNTFRVVNQFRLDEPGGQAHKFIVPDVVLFVNGIPLVVVECKSPFLAEPMAAAIDQLQRFSNQRDWVEGNERLFHFNQFLVATCFDEARAGAIGAESVHFLEWKDTSPVPTADIARALGKTELSSQETLAAGVLRPAHLLDLVRHFTLLNQVSGRTVKVVARYQQFRAVHEAVRRLKMSKTRLQDGEHDRRGGLVWHTQGSGKSLTMVFLVRKMRSDPELRRFKVVVVTDRKDLQDQLAETAALTGEMVNVVKPERRGIRLVSAVDVLKERLAQHGPGLVFAMIQKYHERTPGEPDDVAEPEGAGEINDRADDVGEFPILNEDESILVLVDEAHRSHGSAMHANLLKALPNCARIGFTGTPILMGDRKRTHEIFGDFLDRYTIKQSEADGSTVPILYEGRTAEGDVADDRSLDAIFEDLFRGYTPEELERIKRKYATTGHVLEAPKLIAAKARDMLRHYIANVLLNGFKAQVVAVTRRAAVRYFEALQAARAELVGQLAALDPGLLELTEDQRERLPDVEQFLVRAHRHLDTIKALEFAPVISGALNDDPAWATWTDETQIKTRIGRFKKPLFHPDPERRDPLAFLIVKSMLLTGFNAPIEQAL
jgi:type I restriction enzyme, R subunit